MDSLDAIRVSRSHQLLITEYPTPTAKICASSSSRSSIHTLRLNDPSVSRAPSNRARHAVIPAGHGDINLLAASDAHGRVSFEGLDTIQRDRHVVKNTSPVFLLHLRDSSKLVFANRAHNACLSAP